MVREAITVQVGGFANYVGAHYWNIQASLACKILHAFVQHAGNLACRSCTGQMLYNGFMHTIREVGVRDRSARDARGRFASGIS